MSASYRISVPIWKLCIFLFFQEINTEKLTKFIETLNGKDRTRSVSLMFLLQSLYVPLPSFSHLVTAHPGPLLSDILLSSPILTDEEGAPLAPLGQGFEFGIDPTEDPELAMVHYVYIQHVHVSSL